MRINIYSSGGVFRFILLMFFTITVSLFTTVAFSLSVIMAFPMVSLVLASAVFVNTTETVSVTSVAFTTALPSTTDVPGEEEVRVVVAVPFTVVLVGEAILPSVVENVTSTPLTPLPNSSVTLAVIFECPSHLLRWFRDLQLEK